MENSIKNSGSKLEINGGFLNYTIEKNEITLDLVCVTEQRKGLGTKLVKELQKIAREKNLKIGLYAEPCALCDTIISEDDLFSFYEKLGFEKDEHDIDGKLLTWN